MWYFILALLFGQPAQSNTSSAKGPIETPTAPQDGDGGDSGAVVPPKKP
ncbi:hypothetical protein [Sphingobacterium psychroaquaticum]|nr:hypothetical protein [Sphingobacterium psychroaquaticum]